MTPENRGVLRELRARELALWEDAPGDAGASPRGSLETPREDRESQLILMLLGATALAIWLHTTVAAMRFVEGWDSFRGWIAAIVGG
ncbi:MAG: hypothetical protein JNL97_06960 [Verrucomicrobiales bacterium]|nr:hypothetical protein [Verrucomicrobiales bacterium]